jgi:Ca2+-binding RTX toxin-like protein
MPRPRALVIVLAATAALALLPSAGLAHDPAADLSLRQWAGAVPELVIRDRAVIDYEVTNQGPDAAGFLLRVTLSSGKNQWYHPIVLAYGPPSDACQVDLIVQTLDIACPTLASGESVWFRIEVAGNAPGAGTAAATLSGMLPDPDESDNATSWQTSVVCSINGTPTDDVLVGTEAVESICGGDGNDHLTAVGSDDELFGEAGDDLFDGAGGVNWGYAIAGTGFDTATYTNADRAITICRVDATYSFSVSNWAPTALVDIERFVGSPYDDLMEGTSGTDILVGGAGSDRLVGLSGRDDLRGGSGADKFITRDTRRDVIRGGIGSDRARVDRSDVLLSAQRVSTAPFTNLCDG